MPTAVGNELLWLDEDSGTVSSRLSEVDETFGPGFVTYLARFLLNYDEGCREYFNDKLDLLVPRRDGSHIWEEFRVSYMSHNHASCVYSVGGRCRGLILVKEGSSSVITQRPVHAMCSRTF